MLPGRIVGSVIVGGKARPFLLDVPTGRVTLDRCEAAHPMQRSIGPMEREAIERQVKGETGAAEVRIGQYRCPKCNRWVDVVSAPSDWSGDHCANC
jgi:hypothetical protein